MTACARCNQPPVYLDTHTHSSCLLQLLRVRLQRNVHPRSRWGTEYGVMCVVTLLQQYAPDKHVHTQTHTGIKLYVLSTFLCISLSPKSAFPHTPTTAEPLHSPESTIAQVIQRSKVCYSSERASWATSNKTDATGLCMCASLLTWAKPLQHNVYFCTLARAPLPYICTAVTVFVSKASPASNPVHSL